MTEVFEGEFKEVEARLRRYQPAGPSAAAQQRTSTILRATPRPTRRLVTLVAAAAVIALLAGLAWWMPRRGGDSAPGLASSIPEAFRAKWAAASREPLADTGAKTPVTVVIFTDWQCAPCLTLYAQLKPVLKRHEQVRPGAVSVTVEDWPWNSQCNPGVPVELHPAACDLATAVRLARARGREDEMLDWIRQNYDRLNDADPVALIKAELRLLLGTDDVDRALEDMLVVVQHSVARSALRGIPATPTVFINGVRLQTAKAEEVSWAIQLELARLGISEEGRWRSSK